MLNFPTFIKIVFNITLTCLYSMLKFENNFSKVSQISQNFLKIFKKLSQNLLRIY